MVGSEAAFLKLAKSIPNWSGWGAVERRRLVTVAQHLAYLAFWNDGMLVPLRRIASGHGKASDIHEIAAALQQTETGVGEAVAALKETRGTLVATARGMEIARELDDVVWEKIGPGKIRPRLQTLVEERKCSEGEAKALLKEIASFNRRLDEVHAAILQTRTNHIVSRKGRRKKRTVAEP